ncbi:MAG: Uma2 family endonuclease [Spirochaetaceae bacterium]|jgi:Uma2 family endonuclease|nr:Uma2 family endonuclease [Spirochaetaceae bacterium]
MLQVKEQEPCAYTYADFLSWDEDERYEIIDGEAYLMATPSRLHQEISRELLGAIWAFLKGKPCRVYAAPFSVRLNPLPDHSDNTVVEPDIVVVCDPAKLDNRGCNGPPDLVIEILSPSNTRHDRILKFQKYRQAGVREYWIVDGEEKSLTAYVLKNNEYVASAYEDTDTAPVTVLPGLEIDLNTIFAQS